MERPTVYQYENGKVRAFLGGQEDTIYINIGEKDPLDLYLEITDAGLDVKEKIYTPKKWWQFWKPKTLMAYIAAWPGPREEIEYEETPFRWDELVVTK